jgi:hypothetical protein
MNIIAASNAMSESGRVWPQHQAGLTLLSGLVSNPSTLTVRWLDLACGEGQILMGLRNGFAEAERRKLAYTGFDRKDAYVMQTEKIALSNGLQSIKVEIGNLSSMSQMMPGKMYDFVTLINAVHEIDPNNLAGVLVDATLRLTENGILYVYDMETIEPPELGAIAWKAAEFQGIIGAMLGAFGAGEYRPSVQRWEHKTREGWSVALYRQHLSNQVDVNALRGAAECATTEKITELLKTKLDTCKTVLENLTNYGPETADEQSTEQSLLHDFWAMSRALEAP